MYQLANSFLTQLFEEMNRNKILLQPHWTVDHLCYRVTTNEDYLKQQRVFSDLGELLIESEVSGRMISTFKLHMPIKFEHHAIELIELPAPKKNKVTVQGFEHIEIVTDKTFAELISDFKMPADTSGLKKSLNQELEYSFGSFAVKFHQLSLESVIKLEKNKRVNEALKQSQVLEVFSKYSPLIAGTFPLGIDIESSDLDILLTSNDLNLIQEDIKNFIPEVKVDRTLINGEDTIVANFNFQDVAFELFAQKTPSVKQRAYKYFQVEERLLRLGGRKLFDEVISLCKQGIKAELAFAQALKLSGDPFAEILNLHKKSDQELLQCL